MVKEFLFHGKSMDEILGMGRKEFAELLNARGRRSLLRHQDRRLEKRIAEAKSKKLGKPLKTHLRDAIITPEMVGLKFAVYNGKEFVTFEVLPEMIGHYLGEFALTRKKVKHGKAGIGATKSSTAIAVRG